MKLIWFKRDLRVTDHLPLINAMAAGQPVAGLYVYEPEVLSAPETDPTHIQFINECLVSLKSNLEYIGIPLLLRHGEMVEVLNKLNQQMHLTEIYSHEETGLLITYERDKRVKKWCLQHQIDWHEYPQNGVVRPLSSRNGWSNRWYKRIQSDVIQITKRAQNTISPTLDLGALLTPEQLGMPRPRVMETRQTGGAETAKALIHSFLTERGEDYQKAMSSPLFGANSCSRLSPYIAFGAISIREAYEMANQHLKHLDPDTNPKWRKSIRSFLTRLHWHCHFMQKLEDEPEIETRNMNRAYDGMRLESTDDWQDREWQLFEAWKHGQTGYPMVDACMRSLHATGWINFRMRAMLISFTSYHLWLHWQAPAQYLARLFLDFEPGIHYPQVQMQAGVTGINTIRIYSPAKQGKDQDPAGVFTRTWVPELKDVPDEYLFEPHLMPPLTQHMARCVIGEDYPSPIVDHKQAYQEARTLIFSRRGTKAARSEAQKVYNKHGSRKSNKRRSKQRTKTKTNSMALPEDRGGAIECEN